MLGTVQGLTMAVAGFGNTALILVAAALFLAAAMTITGLDRRIALRILSLVGTRTSRVVLGNILVAIVLSFLIPSATARAAAMVPIMLGIVAAFGADRRSRFASLLMITTAQGNQRLECRGKDGRGAEHDRDRLHPEDARPRHNLGELAGRGGAVFHRAVDRPLRGDDGDAAAGGRHRAAR